MQRTIRIALGVLLWVGSLWLVVELVSRDRVGSTAGAEARRGALSLILEHVARDDAHLDLALPWPVALEVGDLVLTEGKVVGRVEALLSPGGDILKTVYGEAVAARLCIGGEARAALRADASARLIKVPQTFPWVVETLLTPENALKIARLWNDTMLEHREEIFGLLTPIVRDLLLDLERHVESQLPSYLERHRAEVAAIKDLLREEMGGDKLQELLATEAWPAAQARLRPIVEVVSREIWERLPVWGLSWRFAYQSLPLTDNDHVLKEWTDFLEKEALPIFRAHSGEVTAALRDGLRDVLAKDSVQSVLRDAFTRVLSDSRFHLLVQSFLRELFLDNGAFHELVLARLRSPEAQAAMAVAAQHIEPMLRKMGDIVLGTRQEGITKEFARVLRSQILLKDLHRIELAPGSETAPPLAAGATLQATVAWDLRKEP